MLDLDTRCELTELPTAMCDHCRTVAPPPAARRPGPFWRRRAACRDTEPGIFFAPELVDVALRVCARCPVRADCLYDAVERREVYGVLGGMDPGQRQWLQIRRGRIVRRPKHDGRPCAQCGGPVPYTAGRNTKYCSAECREQAKIQRMAGHG